jgi:hypothetical protein
MSKRCAYRIKRLDSLLRRPTLCFVFAVCLLLVKPWQVSEIHPNVDSGFGAVLTDRQKADVLRLPHAELEDHFGDVDFFKRYILSHPRRIV